MGEDRAELGPLLPCGPLEVAVTWVTWAQAVTSLQWVWVPPPHVSVSLFPMAATRQAPQLQVPGEGTGTDRRRRRTTLATCWLLSPIHLLSRHSPALPSAREGEMRTLSQVRPLATQAASPDGAFALVPWSVQAPLCVSITVPRQSSHVMQRPESVDYMLTLMYICIKVMQSVSRGTVTAHIFCCADQTEVAITESVQSGNMSVSCCST